MRTFVRYDEEGRILSVIKAEFVPEGLEHPFYLTSDKEGVIEIKENETVAALDNLEIHDGYMVDVTAKKLVPKAGEGSKSG